MKKINITVINTSGVANGKGQAFPFLENPANMQMMENSLRLCQ